MYIAIFAEDAFTFRYQNMKQNVFFSLKNGLWKIMANVLCKSFIVKVSNQIFKVNGSLNW